ncbi:MAG: hypothetical protein AAF387_22230, partial [Pseudomonadota bacterium]
MSQAHKQSRYQVERRANLPTSRLRCSVNALLLSLLVNGIAWSTALAVEIDWIGGDGAWEDGSNWPGAVFPTADDFVTLPVGVSVTSSGNTNIAEELLSRGNLDIDDGLFTVIGTIDAFEQFVVRPNAAVAAGRIFIQANGVFDINQDATVNVVEGVFSSGLVDIHDAGLVNAESFDNFNAWKVRAGGSAVANSMINHGGALLEVFDATSLLDLNGNLTNAGELEIKANGSADIDSIDNNNRIEIVSGGSLSGNSVENFNTFRVVDNTSSWSASN